MDRKFTIGIILIVVLYIGMKTYQCFEKAESEKKSPKLDSLNCLSYVSNEVKILMDSFQYENYHDLDSDEFMNLFGDLFNTFLYTTSDIYTEMKKNQPSLDKIISENNKNQKSLRDFGLFSLRDSLMNSTKLRNNYPHLNKYLNTVVEIDSLCNHYITSPESREIITRKFFELREVLISPRCK